MTVGSAVRFFLRESSHLYQEKNDKILNLKPKNDDFFSLLTLKSDQNFVMPLSNGLKIITFETKHNDPA